MSLGKWIFDKICNYLTKSTGDDTNSFLCDFDRICHEIIPGDILLIEGRNRISNIIKNIVRSPWTHAALYIGRLHSIESPEMRERVRKFYTGNAQQQLLVETIVGRGTEVNPITAYKNHHIRICRPTGISHTDAQKVINFAVRHLGNTYDVRHFIDLGRFLIAGRWYVPRRWKSSLFTEKPSEISKDICSAMLAEAFLSVRFPILPLIRRKTESGDFELIHRNPKLFTPSDFDYSPFFSIIKYPIFTFMGAGPYQQLPWNEALLSHDDGIVIAREPRIHNEEEPPKA